MARKGIISQLLAKSLRYISGYISIFYPILFKGLFELVYIYKTSVYYAYLKHYFRPNYEKLVISWLILGILLFFSWQMKNGKLKDITRLFMYMNIIPTLSVFWLKNEDSVAFSLIMLYWFIWYIMVYFINAKIYQEKRELKNRFIPSNDLFMKLLFLFVLITTVFFSMKYGNLRLFVSFADVDLYRHVQSMNFLESYIFSWNTNFILPFLIIVHMKNRKWILTGIDISLFLLSYSIFVNKSIFFTMLMAIIIAVITNYDIEHLMDKLIGCFLVLYQIICIVIPMDVTVWLVALNQRLLAGPAEGHFYYFDFFSHRELLYLRESILARFFQSPYREKTAILIGSDPKYGMGIWNYFNNGLFSSAYGNFGVVGVIVHPIIIVFTYLLFVRLLRGFDNGIQYTLLLSSVMYLISTTYTSWWLTGGLLVEILILSYLKIHYMKKSRKGKNMGIKEELIKKIEKKQIICGVVGLGYVGLPLAVEKAKAGFKTVGFDVQAAKVSMVNQGQNYIGDVVDSDLCELVKVGMLAATTDFSFVKDVDFIAICVPTPLDEHQEPDISCVKSSAEAIAKYLKKGTMVVLESTTYPGTTEELIKPILEKGSGLQCGKDFYLGFSPERVDPGNLIYKTKNTPKVVGAIGRDATEVISAMYRSVLEGEVFTVSSPAVAEMEKILENTYRNINIGLVNELGRLCHEMHISIWEVIDAAKTKPYGFQAFYPGPGLGGHCIPLDPYYLTWKAREYGFHTTLIENSMVINDSQPEYCVERAMHILNRHKKAINGAYVLMLGISYKQDIDDYRESPAIRVWKELKKVGAKVDYYDPWVSEFKNMYGEDGKSISQLTPEIIAGYDLVMITTAHSNVDYNMIQKNAKVIFDTKNAMKSVANRGNIELL